MPSLFISYRRTDSPDTVKLIHERLKKRLPRWEIFYDHESIPLGEQFPKRLRTKVASATVVLVIIGPKWLEILHERKCAGVDHVRTEVRLALEATTSVVPILVGRAAMPTDADLGDFADLQPLLQRNGRPVRPDPDFEGDLETIIAHLKQFDSDETIGATLADKYTLITEIAHGGMGVVYLAEQKQPVKRTVAVKLIKPGMDSREVLARFDAERQALAVMDHPNIAKVHDAGMTASGRPFFVMEYVKGVPITQYCDEKKLTPQERLNLFILVCNAVQHAHGKGIIHRDVKPSNVLIEVVDGKPVPKVIDFGLAKALGQKLTDKTLHTSLDMRVGTLEYSAPEQAAGRSFDVDERSDVYSLGVVLYELLTGAPPFTREAFLKIGEEEMRRVIREDEPTKPSKKLSSSGELPAVAANRRLDPNALMRQIRGELDWIVMKALEKEPARRYVSARAFSNDVQLFLNNEPISAGRPSVVYRLRKFIRRRGRILLLAGLVLVGLSLIYLMLADSDADVPGGELVRRGLDREGLSAFRLVPSKEAVGDRTAIIRARCREILRTRQDSRGWYCRGVIKDKQPEVSVWTHNQAMAALLRNRDDSPAVGSALGLGLKLPFDDNYWPIVDDHQRLYGWLGYDKCPYTLAEPALWFHMAAIEALKSSSATAPADRDQLEARLESVQQVLDLYYFPASGGWNKFPNQSNLAEHDPYSSTLGLMVLLDLKSASRGWHGDQSLRDRMIFATVQYLLSCYQAQAITPGWSTSTVTNRSADGLTIQIYSVLLRAEAEAGATLPPQILAAMSRHVADFKRRTMQFPEATGQVIREFRDHTGTVRRVQESVNFLWYPWAVELSERNLNRMIRQGRPREDVLEMRRIQGHLIFDLSDEALKRAEDGNTFLTSEILYCFSSLP